MSQNPIDRYEVVCLDGTQWGILFFDLYHPRRSNLAPEGYALTHFDSKLGFDSPFGFGCNGPVKEFPHQLRKAIIRMFGSTNRATMRCRCETSASYGGGNVLISSVESGLAELSQLR